MQPPSHTVAALSHIRLQPSHIRLQAWDHAVDLCLSQLPGLAPPSPLLRAPGELSGGHSAQLPPACPPEYVATAFFTEQVRAWVRVRVTVRIRVSRVRIRVRLRVTLTLTVRLRVRANPDPT